MLYVYALQLEKGKYYIGKTSNPQFRLESHFNSNGSEWTKLYKPVSVLEMKPNCDDYDEDKITRQYMDKYGINNVRGGSFVTIKLDKSTVDTLQQMSNGTNNRCFICGTGGHFAKDCQENNIDNDDEEDDDEEDDDEEDDDDEEVYELIWGCEFCGKEFTEERKCTYHEKYCKQTRYKSKKGDNHTCFRCGREGHYSSSCYASTHVDGYSLK